MESEKQTTINNNDHYIVGVGASAGGLEPIHDFFDNMPSNGNLSFVIIQHLSPDHKSLLVELVSKHTNMKVFQAEHALKAEKNCIYVIPNNKLLTIHNGSLQLTDKVSEKAPNTAIDIFLKSLAEDQGSKAIAIILSGTGTDGSRGIQTIQDYGGMVLVQDPLTAKFDGMPNSAIATGVADYILAPELMPEEIYNYINERPVRVASAGRPDESLLPEILKLIEQHCQYDFHNYKTPTILRRIGRRMGLLSYKNFAEYVQLLRNSPEECRLLGKEFLIGVTKFFRDSIAFQILREQVLPTLVRSKDNGDTLKIWVTACSTGEEAYSIAILVDDLLQSKGKSLEVKIFATDIDMDAIEFASKATYPAINVADIDEHLVKRYFTREGNKVIVQPRLRKQIVFARHNILKDPPFIKNDMVTCRNMLIYMNNILQGKVLSTLQFSLNTGGYLFLGPSEVPALIREGFEEINGKWKIFRKISNDNRYNPERFPSIQAIRTQKEIKHAPPGKENGTVKELAEDFKSLLTEEYGFAAIYIDKNFEIKEAVGEFRKYLSLPDRISALNILKMVGGQLSVALNAAVRKAIKENSKVSLNNVRLRNSGKDRAVNLFIKPSSKEGYIMIVLGESHENNFLKPSNELAPDHALESTPYVAELEDELKETRLNLQLAIESLETANEELQSSNEELLSANEELQSSNEELQSLNEELHTLNTEHQLRIRELIDLNDDLNNYFRSSDIAQVFVDANLRIRKFNPVAVKMINLIEGDIGRPIDHISTNIKENENFIQDIQQVIRTRAVVEREVELGNGSINIMKILPYVRLDHKIDGVVVTFVDISNTKKLDNIIKAVFNSSLSAIMAFKAIKNERLRPVDFEWIAANYASDELLHRPNADYIGKLLSEIFPALFKKPLFEKLVKVLHSGQPLHTETQLEVEGDTNWYEIIATGMKDGLVISLTNINEKKKADEKFRKNYQELMSMKENYRNLNAALEEKVKERTYELSQTEERFRLIANATSDAIWDWDLVNNRIWWSESFYSLFGFEKKEHKLTSNFWIEHIHADDRERVTNSIYEAINSGSKNWSERFRFQKKDGSYALIMNRGTVLLTNEGTPYRMVGSMMDITEIENSQSQLREKNDELHKLIQEFRFVTDFMPQMVWATQPDGYHDFYNKRWYDYTGLSFEETSGPHWNAVLHPEDRERAWKVWDHSVKTGEPYEIEYRLRRHDGDYRWFLGRAFPLRNEKGNIVKWFGTCTDIHDQKMMSDVLEQRVKERTEELQKMNRDLEASNHELMQFASVASHDLKEPLRKIHMFGNLVRDRYLDHSSKDALDYMNRIVKASSRMTNLVNDLLAFTRLSGETSFELKDLSTIVHEVLSDLELSIHEKNAIIEVGDMPSVEIITGQMRQVFQNIVSNALKFTRPDVPPHIKITATPVGELSFADSYDQNGPYCRITIEDNGIGFNDQYAEKIFIIFQRLHAWEKYDGTGIGLAITKKIIERHNGIITAKSREGKGTTFIIVLPVKQDAEQKQKIRHLQSHLSNRVFPIQS